MKFCIEQEIFDLFPGMKVVTAVAKGLKAIDTNAIFDELTAAWQYAAAEAVRYGNAQSHPNIAVWGERMKAAGAPRKKFPSSIESLARRAGKGDEPIRIGPFVDFYNTVSLKHIVPAGGYDIDALKHGLTLRLSREGDTFEAMDADELINLPAGEVSYADGTEVVTRHFVWKQSRQALITPESKNVIFVSEILSELPPEAAEEVRREFAEGLLRHFNVDARTDILDSRNPEIEF
jgi:DNA/RNA-binding domain of Phe-tRNA-synthetase-like protein